MFLFLLGKIGFLATIGFTLMMMISHPILQIGVMLSYEYLWVNMLTYHIAWDKERFLGLVALICQPFLLYWLWIGISGF